jgi:nucleoside-diphosphate-sugar epimerase
MEREASLRVLLTGAAGFVGSHVARELTAAGAEVVGVVRPGSATWRLEGLADSFSVWRIDLADTDSLRQRLATWRPDVCMHLAWYAVPGKYLNAFENVESLRISLALLEELSRAECGHLVAVGTCAEYEMRQRDALRENSPIQPDTLYAACKASNYFIGRERLAQLGIGFAWARIFYLYGPYEDEQRMIPSLIRTLLAGAEYAATSGNQVRDYLHVSDVAGGLAALAGSRATGTFNVCSGEPVQVGHLMTTLGDMIGRRDLIRLGSLPDRDWEPAYVCGDSSLLRKTTAWLPRYGLEVGLKHTLEWWKSRMSTTGPILSGA